MLQRADAMLRMATEPIELAAALCTAAGGRGAAMEPVMPLRRHHAASLAAGGGAPSARPCLWAAGRRLKLTAGGDA